MAKNIKLTGLNSDVRVRLFSGWFERDKQPGGETYETAQTATRYAWQHLKREIEANHSRSGDLSESLRVDMSRRDQKNVYGLIRSDVHYAEYFFYGTPTITTTGKWMRLEDPPGYTPKFPARPPFRQEVSGQSPKFALMNRAMEAGIARVRGT